MFHTIIEDIIELQQMKRKKIVEEDLAGPVTEGNMVSDRNPDVVEPE